MADENKKLENNENMANEANPEPAKVDEPAKKKLIDKIPKPVKTAAKIAAGTVIAGATVFGAFVLGRAAGFKDGLDTNTVVINPTGEDESQPEEHEN